MFSTQAEVDLAAAALYLAERDATRALHLYDDIAQAASCLSEFPGIGHRHSELTDEATRVLRVGSWYVVYDPASRPVVILRVVHTARSFRELRGR